MKKANKFNIGDIVTPTNSYINWEIKHFEFSYAIPNGTGFAYSREAIRSMAVWLAAKAGLETVGKVSGYGSAYDGEPPPIKVVFKNRLGSTSGYFEQKHVKLKKRGKNVRK